MVVVAPGLEWGCAARTLLADTATHHHPPHHHQSKIESDGWAAAEISLDGTADSWMPRPCRVCPCAYIVRCTYGAFSALSVLSMLFVRTNAGSVCPVAAPLISVPPCCGVIGMAQIRNPDLFFLFFLVCSCGRCQARPGSSAEATEAWLGRVEEEGVRTGRGLGWAGAPKMR